MKNGFVRRALLLAAGSVFLFSGIMVFRYRMELHTGAEYARNMAQMAVIPRAEQSPDVSAAETTPEPSGDAPMEIAEDALKPARVAPIQVDFETLCADNPDIVAWIYCPDTPINYPVVQAEDNDYYMHRLPDGSKSYPGTLFMDYRNADDFSDWNTVIYGHNMRNGSMFGTLPHYKDASYLEVHSEIYLLTPQCDYVMGVLGGFVTPNDSELYNALRPEDAEKESLLKEWMGAAGVDAGKIPLPEDRLVTLSTCSYEYENARYVLMGTLEKLGG